MNIAGITKTSTIDYSGKLSCVVFTCGCNYDCWYCHNRELLSGPPSIDEQEVFSFLKKRALMLEGVVISGGEPTMQSDLVSFIFEIKSFGYHVKLDTNGSNPQVLGELIKNSLVDYVAVDYKAPFELYPDVCAHDASGIKECIELLAQSDIAWEMRTTVISQLGETDLAGMAKDVPVLPLYALQRYRPVNGESLDEIYSPSQINEFAAAVKKYQPNTVARV